MKPDFSEQNVISVENNQERRRWLQSAAKEFRTKGATWLRAAYDKDNPDVMLMDGWKVRPTEEDEPFFFYIHKEV